MIIDGNDVIAVHDAIARSRSSGPGQATGRQ